MRVMKACAKGKGVTNMSRKNRKYRKSLHQQAYDRLQEMQAFGESKLDDKVNGNTYDKIYSFSTYQTYWRHIKYYLKWLQEEHPEVSTLKQAKRYVNDWLTIRSESVNSQGELLSAWTVQTEAAALMKLFQIKKDDPDHFEPPVRRREDIKRSRGVVKRDKHFSERNNDELIRFCKATGCRRNVLEKLTGRDLWMRDQMELMLRKLSASIDQIRRSGEAPSTEDVRLQKNLREALETFPDQSAFLYHRQDKNGKYRFAPIVGPDKEMVIARMRQTPAEGNVWLHVHSGADIHSYRSDYSNTVYKYYARDIADIPYDRINRGSGKLYQSEVYVCRRDEKGKRLDRLAMKKTSIALGHSRLSVVADNYLRNL